MTKFKKCQAVGCDYTATKKMRVFFPGCDEQLGGWDKIQDHGDWVRLKRKDIHRKVNVCKVCYELATVEDFMVDFNRHPSRIEQI